MEEAVTKIDSRRWIYFKQKLNIINLNIFTIRSIHLFPFPDFYLLYRLKTFVNHHQAAYEVLSATFQHTPHIGRHAIQSLFFR